MLSATARAACGRRAGKTTNARVQVPDGMLNINAQPWAEVWVGGERIGETPIANTFTADWCSIRSCCGTSGSNRKRQLPSR